MEERRKAAIYVDLKNGLVVSPKEIINKPRVLKVLKGVEVLFQNAKKSVENRSESEIEKLREYFSSWPSTVWKTGKIPIE